jgi:hypothetical protein
MATWVRFERDHGDEEEQAELCVDGTTLYRIRGPRTQSSKAAPAPIIKRFVSPATVQRAFERARAELLAEGFESVGDVERELPGALRRPVAKVPVAAAAAPAVSIAAPPATVGVDDPRWVKFAEGMKGVGVDPLRSFWDQAQPESGVGEDHWRKCRDANYRALVCLRVTDKLFSTRLPRYGRRTDHEDTGPDARETWETPMRVFAAAAKVHLVQGSSPGESELT